MTPLRSFPWKSLSILVLLTVMLAALAAWAFIPAQATPEETRWSDFEPDTWITHVPFTVHVRAEDANGFLPGDVAYQTSADGGVTWSAWITEHVTYTQPLTTSVMITVTDLRFPDSATANRVRFRVYRTISESVQSPDFTLRVDTTPPDVTVLTPPNGAITDTVTIAGQATDATSGVVTVEVALQDEGGRFWNGTSWQDAATWLPATGTTSWTFTDPLPTWTDGLYTVQARATDDAGWTTVADRTTFRVDTTAPDAPRNLTVEPDTWTNRNAFTLRWTNPDDPAGIAGAWYKIGAPPQADEDGHPIRQADIDRITNLALPAEGELVLHVWLEDGLGHVDHTHVATATARYDATPPEITPDIRGIQGENGWYTSPVIITLRSEDALSGVAEVHYQVDGGAWQVGNVVPLADDGRHTVSYQALDVAGNQSPIHTLNVNMDQTPPTVTYTIDAPLSPSGWYRQAVHVHLEAQDETSGIAEILYRLDEEEWKHWPEDRDLLISDDGDHYLMVRVYDEAGNHTTLDPIHVPVDRLAPVTAYLVDGVAGESPWYVSPITVTLIPTDTASGVVATYYRVDGGPWQEGTQFHITTDGQHEIEFYSVDAAGWQEQGFPTPVWVDTTAPPAPPYVWVIPSTWTNRNEFRVEWATPSDLSQVVGVYYRLDTPPTAKDDGTFVPDPHQINPINVPAEGAHTLYLWLRDGAGNADYANPAIVEDALKFDATPPTTTITVTGQMGENGWFTGPVTATFTVTDAHSGADATFVAVDNAAWTNTTKVVIQDDGKHVVRYYSVDRAGNRETTHRYTVRVDTQAPPVPEDLRVVTHGWQHENRFLVRWTPPPDESGIAGIRYTLNRPPNAPDDGEFAAGVSQAYVRVPDEGKYDVYIWLVDRAGNSDHTQARHFQQALWFDSTPPHLEVTVTGREGLAGWYVSPVTVQAVATDTVSDDVRIFAAIDGAPPTTLEGPITLDQEGTHHLRIWAQDAAGNVSATWDRHIAIDLSPPRAWMVPLPPYHTGYRSLQGDLVGFDVQWRGEDGPRGSGVVYYEVQVRDGFTSPWVVWLPKTSQTSGLFIGQIGHTYFFRIRAWDKAGHERPFTTSKRGDTYTHLESVRNGDFQTGNFLFWKAARVPQRDAQGIPLGTGLKLTVKGAPHYAGGASLAAWLGDPEYGTNEEPGMVPIGGAVISQTVVVPLPNQMPHPTLEFWYHMVTWDVRYSPYHHRWQDTFEFRLLSLDGRELDHPLWEGYEAQHNPAQKGVDYAVRHDLGWRRFRYDLTPYAGQTITLEFSNWNRWDNKYNTYTVLDDVRIVDMSITPTQFLPMVTTKGYRNRQPQEEEPSTPVLPVTEGEPER